MKQVYFSTDWMCNNAKKKEKKYYNWKKNYWILGCGQMFGVISVKTSIKNEVNEKAAFLFIYYYYFFILNI